MTEYLIGDIISATSSVYAGENQTTVKYEWTWDNVILSNESNSAAITIDTSGESAGGKVLSLRILNDCGEWSTKTGKTIDLIATTGNLNITNCLSGYGTCSIIAGDTINIDYSSVNFNFGGKIILKDANGTIKKTWIDFPNDWGSISYTTSKDDPLGIWSVEILYKEQSLLQGTSYVEFELLYYCPIPTADFVLT